MPVQLDVYRDWLGIKDAERPLNHYQVLRLKKFDDDPAKAREHYRKMNAHVRKYAAGDFARQSQELLNELAKAMLCLTDERRKREYDATLGRKDKGDGKRRSLEEILLARKIVGPDQLAKARGYASAVGVDIQDAIMQQKLARPDVVIPAYAESIGLPYLDLADIQLDPAMAALVPAVLARQHSLVPVMVDDRELLVATANPLDPNVEEELRLRFGMPVRTVLSTPAGIHEAVDKYYSKAAATAEMSGGAGKGQSPAATAAVADDESGGGKPDSPGAGAAATKRRAIAAGAAAVVAFGGYYYFASGSVVDSVVALVIAAAAGGAVWGTMVALKK